MENTFQLQHEQAKQEGLTARLPSKSPSAQGKGREGTACSCTIPGAKKGPGSYQVFLALCRKFVQPTLRGLFLHWLVHAASGFSRDTGKLLFVSLPQSFFIPSPPTLGWGGEKQQQKTGLKMWYPETGEREGRMRIYFLFYTYDVVLAYIFRGH